MDKYCPCCKETKPTSEFNRKKTTKDGFFAYCKVCNRKQSNEFYKKNPESYKRRAGIQRDKVREYLNEQCEIIKEKRGCSLCVEDDVCCLDFHHLLDKDKSVGQSVTSYTGFHRELHKCVVLCSNCHRKVHKGKKKVESSMLCNEVIPKLTELESYIRPLPLKKERKPLAKLVFAKMKVKRKRGNKIRYYTHNGLQIINPEGELILEPMRIYDAKRFCREQGWDYLNDYK